MLAIVVAKLSVMSSRCLHGFNVYILVFIDRYIHIVDMFSYIEYRAHRVTLTYTLPKFQHFLGGTEVFCGGTEVFWGGTEIGTDIFWGWDRILGRDRNIFGRGRNIFGRDRNLKSGTETWTETLPETGTETGTETTKCDRLLLNQKSQKRSSNRVRATKNSTKCSTEAARSEFDFWGPPPPVWGTVSRAGPALSFPVLSRPARSCPVLPRPVLSCPVLSCTVPPCPVLAWLSCVVLSCAALSRPGLLCPVLSWPDLPRPVLSSPAPSCPFPPCPVVSSLKRSFFFNYKSV